MLVVVVLHACAHQPPADTDCPECVWSEMDCGAAHNKVGVDPACTGGAVFGTATCLDCDFPSGAVVSLSEVSLPRGDYHESDCATTPLGEDGSYRFDLVAPGVFYLIHYEGNLIEPDGSLCNKDHVGVWSGPGLFSVCNGFTDTPLEPLVVSPLCYDDTGYH